MASASLSIPIAFWTRGISTATVSATLAYEHFIVAGLDDGLIWVFTAHRALSGENHATQYSAEAISVFEEVVLIRITR